MYDKLILNDKHSQLPEIVLAKLDSSLTLLNFPIVGCSNASGPALKAMRPNSFSWLDILSAEELTQ